MLIIIGYNWIMFLIFPWGPANARSSASFDSAGALLRVSQQVRCTPATFFGSGGRNNSVAYCLTSNELTRSLMYQCPESKCSVETWPNYWILSFFSIANDQGNFVLSAVSSIRDKSSCHFIIWALKKTTRHLVLTSSKKKCSNAGRKVFMRKYEKTLHF